MNDLKEQAKRIISKGKLLGDLELINMGLEMLESVPTNESPEVESKEYSNTSKKIEAKQQVVQSVKNNITDQFRVDNKTPIDTKYGKRIPLAVGSRSNKFTDDGLEAVELKGKTPPSTPKPKRKVSKVDMTCQVCGKVEKVLQGLVFSEFYRCESCLLKGKS